MSKINATYSSGYYIAPDVDFRKLEDQQRQEQRGKRRKPGTDSADAGDDNVKRQTFAIPFDLFCLHCNRRIARGSHVYTNRRATDQRYLNSIRIWELEIKCRFCGEKYYLRTDPETPKETGGYICAKGCKRAEGDFYALNKENKAAREEWEKAKAVAELDPLAALEKENEAVRQLEERNRQIEEEVERQADHSDSDLLAMLRSRRRRQAERADTLTRNASGDDDDVGDRVEGVKAASTAASSSSVGLPPPPSASAFKVDREGSGESGAGADDVEGEEDADERSYREFEEDMERRWRALEREQRVQRRKELERTSAKPTVSGSEVDRVLARYGGACRTPAFNTAGDGHVKCAPSSTAADSQVVTQNSTTDGLASFGCAVPSAYRNKFLAEDEDEDEGVDGPWKAPLQQATTQTAAPARPATLFPKLASASYSSLVANKQVPSTGPPPPFSGSRQGSNALLRNLVDSNSDEDVTS